MTTAHLTKDHTSWIVTIESIVHVLCICVVQNKLRLPQVKDRLGSALESIYRTNAVKLDFLDADSLLCWQPFVPFMLTALYADSPLC